MDRLCLPFYVKFLSFKSSYLSVFFFRAPNISPIYSSRQHNVFIMFWNHRNYYHYYSSSTRKPGFRVCNKVRFKPACSNPGTGQCLEILDIASRGITLSRQWTTKALIRLRGWAGWSAPLLFAYGKNRFSHDVPQIKPGLHLMFCKFYHFYNLQVFIVGISREVF